MRKGTAIGLALALVAALGLLIWLLDDDPASTQAPDHQAAHSTPAPEDDCLRELERLPGPTGALDVHLAARTTACNALTTVEGLVGSATDDLGTPPLEAPATVG